MQMRVRMIALLLCCALLLLSCGGGSPLEYGLDGSVGAELARMKADFDLELSHGASVRTCAIRDGNMTCGSSQRTPPAVMTAKPYLQFESDLPEAAPAITNYEYHGPYGISPDGSLAVLSIARKDRLVPYATSFVLVNRKNKSVIFQRYESPDPQIGYLIDDIAWSPDSRRFAVLEDISKLKSGLPGIFSLVLGHRVDESTFFLSLYDTKGTLLIRAKVASNLANASGRVFWKSK